MKNKWENIIILDLNVLAYYSYIKYFHEIGDIIIDFMILRISLSHLIKQFNTTLPNKLIDPIFLTTEINSHKLNKFQKNLMFFHSNRFQSNKFPQRFNNLRY